jgi:hypothetical protein
VKLVRDRRGIVMMEFLIALLPVMIAFLSVTQYCFLSVGRLLVRHSASSAARAAVVVVEESEALGEELEGIYNGALAGTLEDPAAARANQGRSGASSGGLPSNDRARLSSVANGTAPTSVGDSFQQLSDVLGARDEDRLAQIRTAAYLPMLTVSPDAIQTLGVTIDANPAQELLSRDTSVAQSIGTRGLARALGAFLYNLGMLAVTFPESPGSTQFKQGPFQLDDNNSTPVTVRVSYLFRCMVPLASLLICDSGISLRTGLPDFSAIAWKARVLSRRTPKTPQELEAWVASIDAYDADLDRERAQRESFKGAKPEFEQVEVPAFQDMLLMMPGARYFMLRSDATLPLQGAKYYPRQS